MNQLSVTDLRIEHQKTPLGLDIKAPRFAWKLVSEERNVVQTAYRLQLTDENGNVTDTGKIQSSSSIEIRIDGLVLNPMTRYDIKVTVWDNKGNINSADSYFETGRMDTPWDTSWIEPEQIPTVSTLEGKNYSMDMLGKNIFEGKVRDFAEFMPVQYIRIPCDVEKGLKKARIYATAHGVYRLEVNGIRPDDRELAPEITAYKKYLQYQTYDVTKLLNIGSNTIAITLGDGWWTGRIGSSGDSCQFGNTTGLLLQAELLYEDGTSETRTAQEGVSCAEGPLIFSDMYVGEKYDARKEIEGWNLAGFDDSSWKPVRKAEYSMDNLEGQYGESVHSVKTLSPIQILYTPAGDTILDFGQVMAGQVEFTVDAPEGCEIKLEHSEVLDKNGNYFQNIFGINKEQTDIYITKEGKQTYRPTFSYHGFRYVRVTGWPGEMELQQFKVYVLSSHMQTIGEFSTSNDKINQLQKNIWWSQVTNCISIPTDCPQRERAGWTGDIMVFAPTMCFNQEADAFLTRWMKSLRAEQHVDGAVPCVVPFFEGYKEIEILFGSLTSCLLYTSPSPRD